MIYKTVRTCKAFMMVPERKRDPVFDVVKAFLMYFVIRGHLVATGIVSPPNSPPPSWIGAMVVGASMPCFFAISGFFAAKAFESRDWPKLFSRIVLILWPIVSFGLVFGSLLVFRGQSFHTLLTMPQSLFRSLWFLRTLAIVNVISAAVFLLSNSRRGRLVLFAIIYAFLVFLPQAFLGYRYWKSVMHMLPYFIFGIFFLRICLESKAFWWAFAASAFFLVVVFTEGSIQDNGMGFYWISPHWRAMLLTKRGLLCFFGRTAMGVAGTIFLLWTFRWLVNKIGWLSFLAPLGTTTLGVYTMHQWILAQVGTLFHAPFPLPNGWKWLIAGIVFLACHTVVILIQRNRFAKVFFFGDEPMLHRFLEQVFAFRNPVSSSIQ